MIAITFALRAESRGLFAQLRERNLDSQVVLVHTGVGRDVSKVKIEEFLKGSRPDFVISSGFAGGVREDLQSGDLILGENFSDRQLSSAARRVLGTQIRAVNIVTTGALVESAVRRSEIADASAAAAVDMETEFIASACAAHGIRFLSLRVISDSVHEPLPLPGPILFDLERQKTNLLKLIVYIIAHPSAGPSLIRFSRQIRRARNNLSRALIRLLQQDFSVHA